jgi:hypothetical protein
MAPGRGGRSEEILRNQESNDDTGYAFLPALVGAPTSAREGHHAKTQITRDQPEKELRWPRPAGEGGRDAYSDENAKTNAGPEASSTQPACRHVGNTKRDHTGKKDE